MSKTIYIDVLFLINFIINYLILFATAHAGAFKLRRCRLICSAFIGAAYGVAVFLPDMTFLSTFIAKLAISALMILISFGKNGFLKKLALFLALSLAFGGVVFASTLLGAGAFVEMYNGIYYLHISSLTLLAVCGIAYAFFSLIFNRSASRSDRKISHVSISANGKTIETTALHDTGNSLRAPKTNASVIISDYSVFREVLPLGAREILDTKAPEIFPLALDRLSGTGSFGIIPYKTVGVPFSLMLTYKPDCVMIDGKEEKDALLAISSDKVSDGGAYSALI